MKKKVLCTILSAIIVVGNTSVAFASIQYPYHYGTANILNSNIETKSTASKTKEYTAKTYYAHLKDLENQEKKLNDKAITTIDMNNAVSKSYQMWDDELNFVYQKLKSKLSKNEFKKLQQEQRKWVTDKEAEVEKVKQQWSGGSGKTFAALNKATLLTKKKVYELAELLYGKNPNSQVPENSTIKTKVLSKNKVYSYDLDGDGKKEKIKYTVIEDKPNTGNMEIILYINNKKKYGKKIEHALNAQYTIADINAKDGYLDLFLIVTSESECLEYAAFQQYQTNRIKTLTSNSDNNSLQYIRGYNLKWTDGKGNFKVDIDTPFNIEAIGCYYCYIPLVMEKDTIKQKKGSTYLLTYRSRDFKYTLTEGIKVYEKSSQSSKLLRTLKKGDCITISKIKPSVSAGSYDFIERVPVSGYAYIEDQNGKKGWIYLDKKYTWENPLFKEVPAWG